jgi:hypothetical protein
MTIKRSVTLVANTISIVTLPAGSGSRAEVLSDGAAVVDFVTPAVIDAPGNPAFTDATDLWTLVGHGLADDDRVQFTASGTNPSTYDTATVYFVISATADTFQLSTTSGGAAVAGTGLDGDGTWTIETRPVVVGADDQWSLPATANARRVIPTPGHGSRTIGLVSSGAPTVTITGLESEASALRI